MVTGVYRRGQYVTVAVSTNGCLFNCGGVNPDTELMRRDDVRSLLKDQVIIHVIQRDSHENV